MPVHIQNLTDRPLVLTLSSGSTLHLAPAAMSEPLIDVEVKNNAKLERLGAQGIIAVVEQADTKVPGRRTVKEPASPAE